VRYVGNTTRKNNTYEIAGRKRAKASVLAKAHLQQLVYSKLT